MGESPGGATVRTPLRGFGRVGVAESHGSRRGLDTDGPSGAGASPDLPDRGSGGGSGERMSQTWYVEAGGRVDGPLSTQELWDRAAAGRLRPADRVSPDRSTWVPAASIDGLVFAPAVAITPPPANETVVSSDPILPGYELITRVGAGACG